MSESEYGQRTPAEIAEAIKSQALELGFSRCGITDTHLDTHEVRLLNWLKNGYHGDMYYMHRHGTKRSRPAELVPGTVSIVSVTLDYLPPKAADPWSILHDSSKAYVSRYALGRDYHKVMRKKLQRLATEIQNWIGPFGYRAFVDSGPVLEKAIAERAGLGWIGKHSNLLSQEAGSWFFLGELFTDLVLPVDPPQPQSHCGSCTACLDACPTKAIISPFEVDAKRCISYHTIELHGSIPEEFRKAMGNRIYGCDDCQLVCPFNKFANDTSEPDFQIRHALDDSGLVDLFSWSRRQFEERTAGSAIRRIGYERWLRNIAVALGNAESSAAIVAALRRRETDQSPIVREHVSWALSQHQL